MLANVLARDAECRKPGINHDIFLLSELNVNVKNYDFEYPTIWLREINDDKYTFAIFGPEGNWKIIDGIGFSQSSRQSGSIPATIVLTKAKNTNPNNLALKLEFIGVEFRDQFGNLNARGKSTKFQFNNHLTL